MAWSSLSSNQMVTEGDMAQSGAPLKSNQTHGSGNKCNSNYCYIDGGAGSSNGYFSGTTNN